MVSSIERFHCIQDSQLGHNGALYREVPLYTGQPAGSLWWMAAIPFALCVGTPLRYTSSNSEVLEKEGGGIGLIAMYVRTYNAPPPSHAYTHTRNSSHLMPKLLHKQNTKSVHIPYVLYMQCE